MGKFFNYLDRYYVPRHQVDPLRLVPMKIFKELVYDSVKGRARTGVLKMVHKVPCGEGWDAGCLPRCSLEAKTERHGARVHPPPASLACDPSPGMVPAGPAG